jgi:hypothetical protein
MHRKARILVSLLAIAPAWAGGADLQSAVHHVPPEPPYPCTEANPGVRCGGFQDHRVSQTHGGRL